jgi:tetraacyldisaccharide 4'-kinase
MTSRRPWALAFIPLYWAGLRTKDALRDAGILRTYRLPAPVVSVGSLSAGGAGKTPVVVALAELLRAEGRQVTVLSRGYGRGSTEVARVDLTVPEPATRFGDEPVLIAGKAGVQVWLGADRYAAGLAAEQYSGEDPAETPSLHLIDDGFQHRRLARAVDIVLITAEDFDDHLLPAGNRREPLAALRRAGAIVLREEERALVEPGLRRWLRRDTPIWTIRRSLVLPPGVAGSEIIAFAGIARPQGFLDMLSSCGLGVIDSMSFPDHHRYTTADMHRLVERLQSQNASAFTTTEKDAVKLTPGLRAVLEAAAPIHIAGLRVHFTDPAGVLAELEARCR